MRRMMWRWSIVMVAMVLAGCATSSETSSEKQADDRGSETSSSSASQLETVSERSSRNQREQHRISGTIDGHVDKLESCYMRGALVPKEPGLAGKLTFGWTIDNRGQPHGVRLLDDQLGSPEITSCIQAVVDGLTFEKPESDSVEVQYPFEFDRANNIPHENWYCRVHRSLEKNWSPPENFDDDQLQQLAHQTIVYAQLTDEGTIREVEFLKRPDNPKFAQSFEQLLHSFGPEGDKNLPMPRGKKLRQYIQSTGLILQNWRDPPASDDSESDSEPDAVEEPEEDDETSDIISDCDADDADS